MYKLCFGAGPLIQPKANLIWTYSRSASLQRKNSVRQVKEMIGKAHKYKRLFLWRCSESPAWGKHFLPQLCADWTDLAGADCEVERGVLKRHEMGWRNSCYSLEWCFCDDGFCARCDRNGDGALRTGSHSTLPTFFLTLNSTQTLVWLVGVLPKKCLWDIMESMWHSMWNKTYSKRIFFFFFFWQINCPNYTGRSKEKY